MPKLHQLIKVHGHTQEVSFWLPQLQAAKKLERPQSTTLETQRPGDPGQQNPSLKPVEYLPPATSTVSSGPLSYTGKFGAGNIVKPWSQGWLIAAGAYPGFCSIKRLEVFLLPLDRMLVHRRSLPRNFVRFPQQIAGTHLYTWVERGTVRVKCLAQEHNTLSPARARTRTARSGVERTNHEATAPPLVIYKTH